MNDGVYVVITSQGEFVWFDSEASLPKTSGHYLVCQRSVGGRPTRWVRYWNGTTWQDSKADRYGPVICWMHCPPVPSILWRH